MSILFNYHLILILTSLSFPNVLQQSSDEPPMVTSERTEYCNPRYNFCISYPQEKLPVQLRSDNGDGIALRSENQHYALTVSGSYGVQSRSTWDLYKDFVADQVKESRKDKVKYVIVTKTYYEAVFSRANHYYYQKLFHRGNKYILLEMEGPSDAYYGLRELKNQVDIQL